MRVIRKYGSLAVLAALAAGCGDGDGLGGAENVRGDGGEVDPTLPLVRDGGAAGDAMQGREDSLSADAMPSRSDGAVDAASDAATANPTCSVPAEAAAEDSSRPTTVVGNGTPASCTSSAFVAAVAKGGVITFDCGPAPATITLTETAKIYNDKSRKIVIDGGGKITLSGGDRVRILYQNTCDQSLVWTTSRCDNQEFPQLTVQNLTFEHGLDTSDDEGGGAIYAQGGRLKIVNSAFYENRCAAVGPDVGGGAVRALQQYQGKPVYVVNSQFGARARANSCSNGGALSSIGVSFTILNSKFFYNEAVGRGANPAQAGTPGGGSGGAIYNDGNTFTLDVCGSEMSRNSANEGGGAIFFVSNDRSGSLSVRNSNLSDNPSGKFETYPGIFVLAKGTPNFSGSSVE